MKNRELIEKVVKREYPFPIRVLRSMASVALVILPMLWISEYPPEEWPFVTGVFVLALWLSGTLVWGLALVAVNFLQQYAVAVAARSGIDLAESEAERPGMLGARVASVVITVVLLQLASWGVGLYAVGVVISLMEMPPLGDRFPLVPLVLAVSGGLGFAAIIAVLAWFFHAMDRNPERIKRFSKQFRDRFALVAEMGRKVSSPVGLSMGARKALG